MILRSDAGDVGPDVVQELRNHGTKEIGPIAKPRRITVVAELPKARSGKGAFLCFWGWGGQTWPALSRAVQQVFTRSRVTL